MFERLKDSKTHPVLLIFALKAHWREKYGDDFVPQDESASKVMDQTKMSQEWSKQFSDSRNGDSQQGPLDQVEHILKQGRMCAERPANTP